MAKGLSGQRKRLFCFFVLCILILANFAQAAEISINNGGVDDGGGAGSNGIVRESNDYCSSPESLNINTRYKAFIEDRGDDDWYKFYLPSFGKLTFSLEVPSGKDYDLEVYSGCNNRVCLSNGNEGVDENCINNLGPGYVYARIYGYSYNDYSPSLPYYFKGEFQSIAQYDLVPVDFTITPTNPYDSDAVTIIYRFKNQGQQDINKYFINYFSIDGVVKQKCYNDGVIYAGQVYDCRLDNVRLSSGSHTLKHEVDAEKHIAESNENNNVKTQSLSVQSKVKKYDLYGSRFEIIPSSPYDSSSITIKPIIVNSGPDNIGEKFIYRFYIDNVLYPACGFDNGLMAGYEGRCEYGNIHLASGSHVLRLYIDPENSVGETNEGNNLKEGSVNVLHDTSGDYDLVVNDIWTEPSNVQGGSPFTLKFSVDNVKPTSINKQFTNQLYIDNQLLMECKPVSLADGARSVCYLPVSLAAGSYSLRAVADSGKAINEINEGNNERTESLVVANPPRYDVVVNSLWVEPVKVISGEGFNARFAVSNLEDSVITKSFITKVYLNDEYKGYCTVPAGLARGSAHGCSVYVPGLNAGNYYLKAVGDFNNDVAESNEGNNQRIINLNVAAKPCAVPDGNSASCDCNYHSDCPSQYPYCQEEYPSPISDGYDACLAVKPLYCGDRICNNGETWQSCSLDCGAPQGRVYVDVKNNQRNPVTGAFVYLDDNFKGSTSSIGKVDFSAGYGNKNVRVLCPDNSYCSTKSVAVDGNEYVGFQCGCNSMQKGALRFITQDGENLPIANMKVYVDGTYHGLTNFLGFIDTNGLNYGVHTIVLEAYVTDDTLQETSPKYIIRNVNLNKELQEETFTITSLNSFNGQVIGEGDGGAILQSDNGEKVRVQLIPLVIVAIVVVGGALWDLGDFSQCATKGESWWGSTWDYTSTWAKCNDVVNYFTNNRACLNKLRQYNQNAIENCKLEGMFLASNFILVGPIAKVGKVGIKLGKAGIKLIPHIDDGFRIIKESENVIKAVKKYTEVTYRIEQGVIKLDKNVVGLLVETSLRAGASEELAERIGKRLSATTFRDLVNPHNIGNAKGELGEIVGKEQIEFGLDKLAKEGARVQKLTGTGAKNTILNINGKSFIDNTLKVEYDGRGILKAWEADGFTKGGDIIWRELTDYDGLYLVDDVFVIGEFKAANSKHILESLDKELKNPNIPFNSLKSAQNVIDHRIAPLEHFYGKRPEIILLTPKDVNIIQLSDLESGRIVQILSEVRKKGYKVSTDVFPIGLSGEDGFDKLADKLNRLYREANPGGGG